MNWLEISYHTTHEIYDLVSHIFIEAGSKGVLLEDSQTLWETHEDQFGEVYRLQKEDYPEQGIIVKGYLPLTADMEAQLELIRGQLLRLDPTSATNLHVEMLAEADWEHSWKEHYHPIKVTPNLLIKPSWLPRAETSAVVEILLDPGMAFGSGTHETTQLCLQLLEKYVDPGHVVIDVGTGSGVLAIAASKLGAKSVYAVDLDEMAVIRAKENVALNDCQNIIVEKNNLMAGMNAWQVAPTLIIANILAPIILSMLEDLKKASSAGRLFICSGIVHHEREMVLESLIANQFEIVEVREKNGWVAVVSRVKG